jgi:uncharacterized protein YukJ
MEDYVLLKGKVTGKSYDLDKTAHYHIKAEVLGKEYDIAVNVGSVVREWGSSEVKSSELLVYHNENYNNKILDKIAGKEYGIHIVERDFALDYTRMYLFNHKKMVLMPTIDFKETYLIEVLEKYVTRSMEEGIYDIYVYGMLYESGLGIHDVHMNQGSKGRYRHKDREWSDGALFFHNRKDLSWTAVFLAFKNQSLKRKR